jgi:hypothetical protein
MAEVREGVNDNNADEKTPGSIEVNGIFSIAEYYSPDCINNTVTCELEIYKISTLEVVQTDTKNIELDFRRPGVCEKDNILIMAMYDTKGARVHSIGDRGIVTVKARLYDSTGSEVNIVKPVDWSWYSPTANNDFLTITPLGLDSCRIEAKTSLNLNLSNYSNYAFILQGVYSTENSTGKKSITGLLSIGLNPTGLLKYLSGPVQIVYSSTGGNPTYYKG